MSRRGSRRSRRAFTLLELLLVLGLIVAMVGIAWPSLRGPLGGARLHEAAKQVRVEMSRTRLAAMESDAVYELQYAVESGQFRVRRMLDLNPAENEECATVDYTSAGDNPNGDQGANIGWTEFALPSGVVFADPMFVGETAATEAVGTFASETADVVSWSTPIVFYPDGTTSTTEFVLRNERGDEVVVSLRGLTGVSQMADQAPAAQRLVR
ncbi:MAG: hypothetical protein KF708_15530 [Pirellulales bacterium]|nr:hypothetical protein [Pirellulales bacterium]